VVVPCDSREERAEDRKRARRGQEEGKKDSAFRFQASPDFHISDFHIWRV